MIERLVAWLRDAFCRHPEVKLLTTGPAFVANDSVVFTGVQIECVTCGEFWHAELDATTAIKGGLEA